MPPRYQLLIEHVFLNKYREGDEEIDFERKDIQQAASELNIDIPSNLGDVLYTFRFGRAGLPEAIQQKAPSGKQWIIRLAGRGRYRFVATTSSEILPDPLLGITKVPDATPGVIALYTLSDEQALLARLRYNRLLDIFTGITCYSLQSHLRTTVPEVGQVETDEIYVGVDRTGAHYVLPIQAKGGKEKLSIVQIEQDCAMCLDKFLHLVCRPIAAQFMEPNRIVLFMFRTHHGGLVKSSERHYRLIPPDQLSPEDLAVYRAEAQSLSSDT